MPPSIPRFHPLRIVQGGGWLGWKPILIMKSGLDLDSWACLRASGLLERIKRFVPAVSSDLSKSSDPALVEYARLSSSYHVLLT
jgi:hypothetical protein